MRYRSVDGGCKLYPPVFHEHHAVGADGYGQVPAIGDDHVDIPLHG
jgi:hypothetical protein